MTPSDHPITGAPDHALACGVYVHLPYCRSRCGYCSFVVSTDDSSRAAYLSALEAEIALAAREAERSEFDAIYLGGGTPSLVPPGELARLLTRLRACLRVRAGAEVTLEANPEDVTPEAAAAWALAGVTRVSTGVQSLEDRELAAVGRRHDAARARQALAILTSAGLSVSADLILGLPEQTAQSFRASVRGVCASGVEHVSVYLLETEKSRAIEEDRRLHAERYLSDDAQADLWLELAETLSGRGFEHYEISNWARPGRRSRHNLKYWRRVATLGLGVSAHELWGERRRANVSGLPQYVAGLMEGRRPLAVDRKVEPEERARERIVLGLRLSEGVPAEDLRARVRAVEDPTLSEDYASWLAEGLLEEHAGRVGFTERGFLLSNEILCRFV